MTNLRSILDPVRCARCEREPCPLQIPVALRKKRSRAQRRGALNRISASLSPKKIPLRTDFRVAVARGFPAYSRRHRIKQAPLLPVARHAKSICHGGGIRI